MNQINNVCKYDDWLDIEEDRILPISNTLFIIMLKKYTNSSNILYKRIYNSDVKFGIFTKSEKSLSPYINKEEFNTFDKNLWRSFPIRTDSLVCYNYVNNGTGDIYVVIPFNDSLFTIAPKRDSNHDNEVSNYNKGYWTDKIVWLDNLNDRELWTDSPCLIVRQDTWDTIC